MRIVAERTARLVFCVALSACASSTEAPSPQTLASALVTDSAEFGAELVGNSYIARVQYTFTNPASVPLSMRHCDEPTPPGLEKNISGAWVSVFPAFVPACLSIPHFRLESGASYRGTRWLHLQGVANVGSDPRIAIDSVNGTYRLRWAWILGPNPDVAGAERLWVVSNEFRIVVR